MRSDGKTANLCDDHQQVEPCWECANEHEAMHPTNADPQAGLAPKPAPLGARSDGPHLPAGPAPHNYRTMLADQIERTLKEYEGQRLPSLDGSKEDWLEIIAALRSQPTPEHDEAVNAQAKNLRDALAHLRCLVLCVERDRDYPSGPSMMIPTFKAVEHSREFLDGLDATHGDGGKPA